MMRSLYSAVSGLKTHQTRMDVIGNNIANVNTEAFKSSSVTFSEIMYQTLSGATSGNGATGTGGVNAKQVGLGVSTGSTSISITTAGAAETTGNPFDLKLTDSQSTNFFIVSDGTNTMFTRAGSFYVDGNGYLCMSSTGYTLMGWQVDPTTGDIRKDTVSSLQVMSPANQTSQPESTSKAYVSGVLDKKDSNLSSEDGYVMALGFYDSLGYSYTAKFKVTPVLDADKNEVDGKYDIELTDILDSSGFSILKDPNDASGETYLVDPGSLFTTGTSSSKEVEKAIRAKDASGNAYVVYNLGSKSDPMYMTMNPDTKDLYALKDPKTIVDQSGTPAYYYITDPITKKGYYVTSDVQQDLKLEDSTVFADGEKLYSATVDGKEKYYTMRDGVLYEAKQNLNGTYSSTDKKAGVAYTYNGNTVFADDESAKLLGGLGLSSVSHTILDADEDAATISGLPVFSDGEKFYAADANGDWHEVEETVTENVHHSYTSNWPGASATSKGTVALAALSNPELYTDLAVELAPGGKVYRNNETGDLIVADLSSLDDGKAPTYAVTEVTKTTYKYSDPLTDGSDIAYYKVTDSNNVNYYVTSVVDATETADDYADLIKLKQIAQEDGTYKYYMVDENTGELYEATKDADPSTHYTSATDVAFKPYTGGNNKTVYLAQTAVDALDEEFDINEKAYSEKVTQNTYGHYVLSYDTNEGTFLGVIKDTTGELYNSATLNLGDLLPTGMTSEDGVTSNFSNVEIDFTKSMNYNNSGTSTMKALKGDIKGDGTGKKLGALTGLTVNSNGEIYGSYDNGNTVLLCQIAAAQFSNASGLEKVGENCYQTTLNSGDFDGIGIDISSDGSSISTGELEMSNVDLSAEFTSMIVTQRGFQANSRVITTSDTLLEELINLKR